MPSLIYEKALWRQGFTLVAGVDEAGRGPLAGPIVAAAVILDPQAIPTGLDDSKKLSPNIRTALARQIMKTSLAYGIAVVSPKVIDRVNIQQANYLVMKRAVEKLPLKPEHLLLDGGRSRVDLPIPQQALNYGDGLSLSIAAASILAKVARDRLMLKYHLKYPEYKFDRHKGYGTAEHLHLLKKHGPSPLHRRSFAPLR